MGTSGSLVGGTAAVTGGGGWVWGCAGLAESGVGGVASAGGEVSDPDAATSWLRLRAARESGGSLVTGDADCEPGSWSEGAIDNGSVGAR